MYTQARPHPILYAILVFAVLTALLAGVAAYHAVKYAGSPVAARLAGGGGETVLVTTEGEPVFNAEAATDLDVSGEYMLPADHLAPNDKVPYVIDSGDGRYYHIAVQFRSGLEPLLRAVDITDTPAAENVAPESGG